MPVLQETKVKIAVSAAKKSGLADLGAPIDDATEVKKGRAHEFFQNLDSGAIGRRFQDLKIIAVKTAEAGAVSARLFVLFEAFGDSTAAPVNGVGFSANVYAGDKLLAALTSSSLFMPYANFWYPQRFVFPLSVADFEALDGFEFIGLPEEVAVLEAATV